MEELKRLRNELGWSQQRLADESGVNKATINQVEQGKRSPSIATLESLARAMGAEIADFFPKAQAPLPFDEAASAGLSRKAHDNAGEVEEAGKYTHLSTLLENVGAAGSVARGIVGEWRDEARRGPERGWPTALRVLEMYGLHDYLSRLYVASVDTILEGVRQGTVSVGRDGDPQNLAPDPSLWPRELRELVYEAGAHIAVLPEIIRELERRGTGQPQAATGSALRERFNVETHLPTEMLREQEWREARDRALAEAEAPA